ncbi:hypothetical protein HPB51_021613 [Rhipicephalus microplus]|uniref:Uncharacterized protein n=1 Tax=Rhipicephalus microplus TaxID=6941 RepID=A0A9J6DQ83_RHIMP|nr:hypothetical protein HPB51_021613 [Rhipicephalus microplus]
MPLVVDPTLSSLELPTFPDLPCLQAYDVTWNTQWDQPSGTTPEANRSVGIKPSPSPPDFCGGGSTLATMSLTHAWLSLQHRRDILCICHRGASSSPRRIEQSSLERPKRGVDIGARTLVLPSSSNPRSSSLTALPGREKCQAVSRRIWRTVVPSRAPLKRLRDQPVDLATAKSSARSRAFVLTASACGAKPNSSPDYDCGCIRQL